MKFKTQVSVFKDILNKIIQIVPNSPQDVIYESVFLKAIKDENGIGNLIAYYSDGISMNLKVCVPVEVKEEGEILVNVRRLNSLIQMKYGSLNMEFSASAEDENIKISTGTDEEYIILNSVDEKFILKDRVVELIDADVVDNKLSYEALKSKVDTSWQALFKIANIKRLINQTLFAVSTDNIASVISEGILFQFKGEYVNTVGMTDKEGIRVARATCFQDESINYPRDIEFILTKKAAEYITKIDDNICMSIYKINNNVDFIRIDNINFANIKITVLAQVVEGRFPEYEKLIPTNSEVITYVPCDLLIKSLKQISAVVDRDRDKDIKWVVINVVGDEKEQFIMNVFAKNGRFERIKCSLPVVLSDNTKDGTFEKGYTTTFNYKLLQENLQNIRLGDVDEEIELHFITPNNTFVFKPQNNHDLAAVTLKPIFDSENSVSNVFDKEIEEFMSSIVGDKGENVNPEAWKELTEKEKKSYNYIKEYGSADDDYEDESDDDDDEEYDDDDDEEEYNYDYEDEDFDDEEDFDDDDED